ncbi:MAG: hypothetical protein EOP47_16130 [Sphingobacteriaceae bacterium]|nr:MAG: hypothetical protein EOP47_16130 [Sphingobacteriaceae bacterium]
MKPFNIIGVAALLLIANTSNAQFLNKLKKKAEAAVSKAVTGSSSSDNAEDKTEDNASEGSPATSDASSPAPALNPVANYGTQLFSMQKGEYLVYGEVSLAIKTDGAHVKVVTKMNRQFYLYDNGERQGPFTTPPVHLLDKGWKREYGYEKNNADDYMNNGMSYLSAGKLVVDGKSYGPALVVNAMYHNTKTKKFYALVSRSDKNNKIGFYLVSEKGTHKLPGIGTGLIVSENGESGGVVIPATQYNAKTDEDMYKYVVADDNYIVLADGKTNGPFKYVDGTRNSLDDNGNYVQIGKSGPKEGIFVNGKAIIIFAEGIYGQGASFINGAGTSAAWFERGSLQFTDGTLIKDNAIQPALSTDNGVQYVNWVSITKGNVYHCKKEL